MIAPAPYHGDVRFSCPHCGGVLRRPARDLMICPDDGITYGRTDGIWNLVAPDRAPRFQRFVTEYEHVRRLEGRHSERPEHYRRLPFVPSETPMARDWRVRAETYRCFTIEVLEPIETRHPLRVLDLGSGNGWLAYRLALRGHNVFAVDLRTGRGDGLGAHVHYDRTFTPVRAEFDRLPFTARSFDLVVFNASFHYAEQYEDTLREVLRVLKPSGKVVVMDTPVYARRTSGETMVRAREESFRKRFGCASDSIDSEQFVTYGRLRQLSARLGITWTHHRPRYGFRWAARRAASFVRNRREPARFEVIVGVRHLEAQAEIERLPPHSPLRPVARALLRARFVLLQRWSLKRDVAERVGGVRLNVAPGVFNPVMFRSGAFLARLIDDGLLPTGSDVLDLGTGTGVCAIAAARSGCRVTAVDVSATAAACADANARSNGAAVDVVISDLFGAVANRRFDVVLFNPPYFGGVPKDSFDLAWRASGLVERFSAALSNVLRVDGFALVVLSSDGRCPQYLLHFESVGHRIARVAEHRMLHETLAVYRLG